MTVQQAYKRLVVVVVMMTRMGRDHQKSSKLFPAGHSFCMEASPPAAAAMPQKEDRQMSLAIFAKFRLGKLEIRISVTFVCAAGLSARVQKP